VAVGVVDLLEVVEVEQRDGAAGGRPVGAGDHEPERLLGRAAIGQAGERVRRCPGLREAQVAHARRHGCGVGDGVVEAAATVVVERARRLEQHGADDLAADERRHARHRGVERAAELAWQQRIAVRRTMVRLSEADGQAVVGRCFLDRHAQGRVGGQPGDRLQAVVRVVAVQDGGPAVGEAALEVALEHALRLALVAGALERAAELLLLGAVAAILEQRALVLDDTGRVATPTPQRRERAGERQQRDEANRGAEEDQPSNAVARGLRRGGALSERGVARREAVEQLLALLYVLAALLARCQQGACGRRAPAIGQRRLLGQQRPVRRAGARRVAPARERVVEGAAQAVVGREVCGLSSLDDHRLTQQQGVHRGVGLEKPLRPSATDRGRRERHGDRRGRQEEPERKEEPGKLSAQAQPLCCPCHPDCIGRAQRMLEPVSGAWAA